MTLDPNAVTFAAITSDHLQSIGSQNPEAHRAAFSIFGHDLSALTNPSLHASAAAAFVEFAGHVGGIESGQLAGPAGIAAIGAFIARSFTR